MSSLSSNVIHYQSRLDQAGMTSAGHTAGSLKSGLSLLAHQFDRSKGASWQGETGFILSNLRNNALDGLDLQCAHGFISKTQLKSESSALLAAKHQATQALFSTASPIGAANALAKNLAPFKLRCESIIQSLNKMVQQYTNDHADTRTDVARETPKDRSDPSKKGI